eukprot:s6852_g4.t2
MTTPAQAMQKRKSHTSYPLVVTGDAAQAISSGKTPDLCACIFGGGGHELPIGREAGISFCHHEISNR